MTISRVTMMTFLLMLVSSAANIQSDFANLLAWNRIQFSNFVMLYQLQQRNEYMEKLHSGTVCRLLAHKPRGTWNKPGKTDDWWVKLRDGIKPDEEWHTNLRVTRTQFNCLFAELRPHLETAANCPNYHFLPGEKRLALMLYYLADMGSLVRTGNTFGVDRSTASKTVRHVCKIIASLLTPKYIKMPSTNEEMNELVAQFETKFHMP